MSNFQKVKESLKWKKGAEYCAQKLNIPIEEYQKIKNTILGKKSEPYEEPSHSYTEDLETQTAEYKIKIKHCPKSSSEIEALIDLDTSKWKILKYSVWNTGKSDNWLLSIKIGPSGKNSKENFMEFLKTYKPQPTVSFKGSAKKTPGMLIINKQDAHLNKYSIDGNNDMDQRFNNILDKLNNILIQATANSTLNKIVYILGSDLFDSEWTEETTKGTPQKSILPYEESFAMICNHEISVINKLLECGKEVHIPFIVGNHDKFVGWHLVNWLKAYYRNQKNLIIDDAPINSKYLRFGNSAFMLNHGDGMKPEKLAQIFPLEFRAEWSKCQYFSILTGDKHHEITRDIGGIRFYQVPAWSKAVSSWDSKHGWTQVKGEMQAFFVTEDRGITNIYKEPL